MKNNNKTSAAAVITAVVITGFVAVFLAVGGKIQYRFDDAASFAVHTALWKDRTVAYDDIRSIELRTVLDTGTRSIGYGSGKLSLGTFQNDEFGTYQLYTYNGSGGFIVLGLADQSVLVIGGENQSATVDMYETISARLG